MQSIPAGIRTSARDMSIQSRNNTVSLRKWGQIPDIDARDVTDGMGLHIVVPRNELIEPRRHHSCSLLGGYREILGHLRAGRRGSCSLPLPVQMRDEVGARALLKLNGSCQSQKVEKDQVLGL